MGWMQQFVVVMGTLGVLGGVSLAQPDVGPDAPKFPVREMTEEEAAKEKARLEKEITAAFARNDFAAAQAGLEELIPLDHENFVPWYNLGCALSMQGKTDEGVRALLQAIARGFADLRGLKADPHMAGVRGTKEYAALEKNWDKVLAGRVKMTIDSARKKFHVGEKGSPYMQEQDERLRLVYISAFDPVLFAQAKADATRLDRWWRVQVLGESEKADDGAGATQQDLRPWVMVVLPTRADYIVWAQERYGERYDRVGGEYNHDGKLLVSMDLGSSWRHEFWHVLHWRHMDAIGERHPLWVMEGLCSLVEDCDEGKNGEMIARPSWRTNMVRRLAKAGNLIPLEVLFETGKRRFMNERPLAYYGEARALFLYLAERGKLRDWYGQYCKGYKEDSTGRAAFEIVLGTPLKEIEKDFKAWARALPEVADEVGRGAANLPCDVGVGGGDGPVVQIDAMAEFSKPGAKPTNTGGLRDKDVITAIDDKPVRDLNDLARVLGGYEAGAVVKVAYLRGKVHGEVRVTLVPPR